MLAGSHADTAAQNEERKASKQWNPFRILILSVRSHNALQFHRYTNDLFC